ncbi:MAG: 23S rRNA (adenine(2503)-C(2))-methyltransferase RlmN [Pseudanabaenaceae cyanobacterium bins.68]|nr:23S rRNA (adenine(2503)-C(2))-methyltransferase RlmN [Pseudanabaenaceae cyanobacterium bins.68]
MNTTKPLLAMSQAELTTWIEAQGQPSYRAQQLHQWLYQKGIHNLAEVTVFPKTWRQQLEHIPVGRSELKLRQVAPDQTEKFLLALQDQAIIETVGIPTSDRLTVCVSTQVGCPMGCTFCATGQGGFSRNLTSHEIVDQILTVQEQMQRRVSHVVFMGMGEPLMNLPNLVSAIATLNQAVGIGQRNFTISTVGIPQRIAQLAKYQLQATLAVSLHAPNQNDRLALIPSAQHYTLDMLIQDCRDYVITTGRRVSFEYTLLAEVNDQPHHANQLAELIRGFQSHVNLIPYNPVSGSDFQRPSDLRIQKFIQILKAAKVAVSVRRTRGLEADAACGQLRGKVSLAVVPSK